MSSFKNLRIYIAFAAALLLAQPFASFVLTTPSQAEQIEALASVPQGAVSNYLIDQSHLIIQQENNNTAFKIELALDEDSRMKGLMYRTKLADGHGMLFDFGRTEPVYMWMKNTYISLDMIFADPDGTIHHIVKGTTPLSESIIGSSGPVRYVLEVPKGTANKLGLKAGDKMLHQLFTPNLTK